MRKDKETLDRINEKKSVEDPFLDQLRDLGWSVLDLPRDQKLSVTEREDFAEVILVETLRESLKEINPWMETDQIEEVVREIQEFTGKALLKNNQKILKLLQEGTSVGDNRQTGEKSPTVRYLDFTAPEKNRFVAIAQMKFRILGKGKHFFPDIVLFVNGLPLVVVECKSQKKKIAEAIDQMHRYAELRGDKGEGNAKLFYYNQILVATNRNKAQFGTISSRNEKHFYRWTDPYPYELEDLPHGKSAPNEQQRLIHGMFSKANLLSLIRVLPCSKRQKRER